jgi:choline dehydrogenase-like flavoprotein
LQHELTKAFASVGIGELELGQNPVHLDNMTDGSHPMGTARMAADPSGGVVDADCKVFGTDNLYVASSATFPTGHSYSPTYTILALSRRLAHHLVAKQMCRSISVSS